MLALVGCSAPRTPAPEPRVVVPPPVDAATIAEPPPIKDPFEGIAAACRGTSLAFDTEDSEKPCLIVNTSDHRLPLPPKELTISAHADPVKSGATASVIVTLQNPTAAPMELFVDVSCSEEPSWPVRALDANKKRVDFIPHKNCDTFAIGCSRRVLRIVLDPNGSMTKTIPFPTTITKVAPDCSDSVIGKLEPGTYTLRVHDGFHRDVDTIYRTSAETTLVVK